MKNAVELALRVMVVVLLPSAALADPVRLLPNGDVEFDARIVTSGSIGCHNTEYAPNWLCRQVPGGAVEIRNGDATATIAFAGLDQTVAVTANTPRLVALGEIVGAATPGFAFPTLPSPEWRMLSLHLTIRHVAGARSEAGFVAWSFAPGGSAALPFLSGDFATGVHLAAPTDGYAYDMLAYQFSTILSTSIQSNGITPVVADVNAIPEPGTLLLIGSGLMALGRAYRRKAPSAG